MAFIGCARRSPRAGRGQRPGAACPFELDGLRHLARTEPALRRLLFETPAPEERERLRAGVRRYCELDTWGMVKLLERLRELAGR